MSRRFWSPLALLATLASLASVVRAAAPIPPPPNGPAFLDNFDTPKMKRWVTKTEFKVSGGKLTLGSPTDNRGNIYVYAAPVKNLKGTLYTIYTNFRAEMRARLVSDPKMWGGFGLWFRTNGAGQYRNDDRNPDGGGGYCFNYIPGIGGVQLVRRAHSMLLGGPVKPVPMDQNWHTFRVDAVGPNLSAYFDGKLMYQAVSPEKPFGYTNGAVGIGVLNRGVVEVDSFRITPLGGGAPGPVATTP